MLTKNEIRLLILHRCLAACDSCNSHHIGHVEGQIKGLLAVLNDGEVVNAHGDIATILKAAKIPFVQKESGEWNVEDEWILKMGGTIRGSRFTHPKIKDW